MTIFLFFNYVGFIFNRSYWRSGLCQTIFGALHVITFTKGRGSWIRRLVSLVDYWRIEEITLTLHKLLRNVKLAFRVESIRGTPLFSLSVQSRKRKYLKRKVLPSFQFDHGQSPSPRLHQLLETFPPRVTSQTHITCVCMCVYVFPFCEVNPIYQLFVSFLLIKYYVFFYTLRVKSQVILSK